MPRDIRRLRSSILLAVLAFEWTAERVGVVVQVVAALLAAVAAGAAWRSAKASAGAVREAQRDRRVERLLERRARFETMRVALIGFREADVGGRLDALRRARLALQAQLPLLEGHDFPQATYLLAAVRGPEEMHSDESQETASNAIGEMEREIIRLDEAIAPLER
jgi:hypothetical protein